MWVRQIFTLRKQQGEYHNLLQEMRLGDSDSHFRYMRMSRERFDCLLADCYECQIHSVATKIPQLAPLLTHRHYNVTGCMCHCRDLGDAGRHSDGGVLSLVRR